MNESLWQRILDFNLEHREEDYGFALRLAKENYWTQHFTAKAILEYRKFMYLAATSDFMVSPSPVIDDVWHQHLIHTQSYNEFCKLLGKRIEHIPSTRSEADRNRFEQAKQRTHELYQTTFGKAPAAIWQQPDMFAGLGLEKARLKIRAFLLWGILAFVCGIPVAYFSIGYLYPFIPNPYFLYGYEVLILATFGLLWLYNNRVANKWIASLPPDSFIFQLSPSEMIGLDQRNVDSIIHHNVNELVKQDTIVVHQKLLLEKAKQPASYHTEEERVVLKIMESKVGYLYAKLFATLRNKAIFHNSTRSTKAISKYIQKSVLFFRVFRFNFILLSSLLLMGITRLITGIVREKPVSFITLVLIVLLIAIILFLFQTTALFRKKALIKHYKKQLIPSKDVLERGEWNYFLTGDLALTATFASVVGYSETSDSSVSCGSGGCGSSCGSSCGGGCGGCGGD
jgi:hypothetical protein